MSARRGEPVPAWRYTVGHIRSLFADPLVWVLAIVVFVLWAIGQALAGEPGLPAESLDPPVYVVDEAVAP